MARQSYGERIARGLARGLTRQEARGHRETPEHPLRALGAPERYATAIRRGWDRYTALAETPAGRKALARANQRRREQGKGPIVLGYPPYPGPGLRQTTFESFEEAEPHGQGIPPDYTTYYLSPDGVTLEVRRGQRSRKRAA